MILNYLFTEKMNLYSASINMNNLLENTLVINDNIIASVFTANNSYLLNKTVLAVR